MAVSGMLNSINDSMSSAGGSVKLQRKGADGIMLDSTQAELNLLDSQARIKTAARVLTTLNPAQKLVWATAKKSEGNARYKSGDHDGAIDAFYHSAKQELSPRQGWEVGGRKTKLRVPSPHTHQHPNTQVKCRVRVEQTRTARGK